MSMMILPVAPAAPAAPAGGTAARGGGEGNFAETLRQSTAGRDAPGKAPANAAGDGKAAPEEEMVRNGEAAPEEEVVRNGKAAFAETPEQPELDEAAQALPPVAELTPEEAQALPLSLEPVPEEMPAGTPVLAPETDSPAEAEGAVVAKDPAVPGADTEPKADALPATALPAHGTRVPDESGALPLSGAVATEPATKADELAPSDEIPEPRPFLSRQGQTERPVAAGEQPVAARPGAEPLVHGSGGGEEDAEAAEAWAPGTDKPARGLAMAAVAAQADGDKPEWLAQIELGQRWRPEKTAGDTGKVLPSALQAQAAGHIEGGERGELPPAEVAAEPPGDSARFFRLDGMTTPGPAESPQSGAEGMAPVQGSGQPQGTQPAVERPLVPERALSLNGSAEQNAKQLTQQVQVMVNQNLQEADIRLNPSELGGVRIQLRLDQGEVNIQFTAHNAQARELLEQAMPRLRDMLGQQGLAMGQGEVGGSSPQERQLAGEGGNGGGSGSGAGQAGAGDDGDWQAVEPGRVLDLANGRIDYFA
jgi:flagellar hook-length control protein FliK